MRYEISSAILGSTGWRLQLRSIWSLEWLDRTTVVSYLENKRYRILRWVWSSDGPADISPRNQILSRHNGCVLQHTSIGEVHLENKILQFNSVLTFLKLRTIRDLPKMIFYVMLLQIHIVGWTLRLKKNAWFGEFLPELQLNSTIQLRYPGSLRLYELERLNLCGNVLRKGLRSLRPSNPAARRW